VVELEIVKFSRNLEVGFSGLTTYSTKNGPDLSIYPPDLATTTKDGSYNVGMQFMHNLKETDEGAWGAYLRVAIADGNPNTIQNSLVGGIGGQALYLDTDTFFFNLEFRECPVSSLFESVYF